MRSLTKQRACAIDNHAIRTVYETGCRSLRAKESGRCQSVASPALSTTHFAGNAAISGIVETCSPLSTRKASRAASRPCAARSGIAPPTSPAPKYVSKVAIDRCRGCRRNLAGHLWIGPRFAFCVNKDRGVQHQRILVVTLSDRLENPGHGKMVKPRDAVKSLAETAAAASGVSRFDRTQQYRRRRRYCVHGGACAMPNRS